MAAAMYYNKYSVSIGQSAYSEKVQQVLNVKVHDGTIRKRLNKYGIFSLKEHDLGLQSCT